MFYLFILVFIALFAFLFVFSIFFSAVSTVLSWFGIGKRKTVHNGPANSGFSGGVDEDSTHEPRKKNKKLFAKDEGEYVDFEEIKD